MTLAEYDRFAESAGRERVSESAPRKDREQRPVTDITWYDAVAYAEWLSDRTGELYLLRSEAEWEYAARAGTETA